MKETSTSNYEKMKHKMADVFLQYNQDDMIKKFALKSDDSYIFISFAGREYRLNRTTGKLAWSDDLFLSEFEGDYNEVMTIYDLLCNSDENCSLSGEWVSLNSLSAIQGGQTLGNGNFFKEYTDFFDKKTDDLISACEALGGTRLEKGDVSYQIPLFEFMAVVLQFWEADDEFPASLQIFVDKNILRYMHYETVMFAVIHLLGRIRGEMEERREE